MENNQHPNIAYGVQADWGKAPEFIPDFLNHD